MRLLPAARPTLHFVGVTTAQSSIMRVFPAWAQLLAAKNEQLEPASSVTAGRALPQLLQKSPHISPRISCANRML